MFNTLKNKLSIKSIIKNNVWLIGTNTYYDLKNKNDFDIFDKIKKNNIQFLKLIKKDAKILFDINNEYEEIFKYINILKSNDVYDISVRVNNTELFYDFLKNNNINHKGIKIINSDINTILDIEKYIEMEDLLHQIIKPAINLSPFEKFIYAYNIVKMFKEYNENEDNLKESRHLYNILYNDYIVCVGFTYFFKRLLDILNVKSKKICIGIDGSYDNSNNKQIDFEKVICTNKEAHSRLLVNLVDEKYDINGYYFSDPTWDNNLKKDFYNHILMTNDEARNHKLYTWETCFDFTYEDGLYSIINKYEYYKKINNILKKHDNYSDLIIYNILKEFKNFDIDTYNKLLKKYPFLNDNYLKWFNNKNFINFVSDFGDIIINKTNKKIIGSTIFKAVKNIYLHSYGYNKDNVDEYLEKVIEYNKIAHEYCFPTRKKIYSDGTEEILNESNKFDFDIKELKLNN